ncbi:MAG: hypothetical protein ABH839_03835 [Chloroflexota bacterium]
MRFRSTGLGKTELEATPKSLEVAGGLLILHVQTTTPVRWHIRAGIQRKDLFKLVRMVFSLSLLKYLFSSLIGASSKEPENF